VKYLKPYKSCFPLKENKVQIGDEIYDVTDWTKADFKKKIDDLQRQIDTSEKLIKRNYPTPADKKLAEYEMKKIGIKKNKEKLKQWKSAAKGIKF